MGMFRVIIKKRTSFQGRDEEFSNVYVLTTGAVEGFNDGNAIDSITALEKAVHATNVTFVRGESYGINPLTGDVPRFGKDLIGGGAVLPAPEIYKENCILVTFELPRSGGLIGIGRRRMLKKWLHVGGVRNTMGAGTPQGAQPLGAGEEAFYVTNYGDPLRLQEHGGGRLAAPNGDLPVDTGVHDYMEHHQFHAGKKRKQGIL